MAKQVVGYIRTSKTTQELSPEAQRQALEEWCDENAAQLVAVFSDTGVSSVSAPDDRPGLSAALATLTRGQVLLVARRDRIARKPGIASLVEYLCERSGARFVSADCEDGDDINAMLLRSVKDMAAMLERWNIKVRTRAALAAKKARGERISGEAPFGYYFDGGRVVEDQAEQRIIEIISGLRGHGYTLADIADSMNRLGYSTRSGGPWHKVAVHRALKAAA